MAAPTGPVEFRDTFFGFEAPRLEEEYQAEIAEQSRSADAVADFLAGAVGLSGAYQMFQAGVWQRAAFVFVSNNALVISRSWVSFRSRSRHKARWRTVLMLLLRFFTMSYIALGEDAMERANLSMPSQSTAQICRDLVLLSRAGLGGLFSVGHRVPFRYHVPVELFCLGGYTYLNWKICTACSPALQSAYASIAQGVTRVVAAGLLLPPPRQPVLPAEHACSAVSAISYLLVALLLPTAYVLHAETKSRMQFLLQREQGQRWRLSTNSAEARAWLEREAALAAFPLLVCLVMLPLTGLLWNLVVHAHHLL